MFPRQHKTPRHCFPVREQKLLAAAEEFPSVSCEAAVKVPKPHFQSLLSIYILYPKSNDDQMQLMKCSVLTAEELIQSAKSSAVQIDN